MAKIVVLAAFSLLAAVATASAECAWVLWGQTPHRGSDLEFHVFRAHPTQQECEASAREQYRIVGDTKVDPGASRRAIRV